MTHHHTAYFFFFWKLKIRDQLDKHPIIPVEINSFNEAESSELRKRDRERERE